MTSKPIWPMAAAKQVVTVMINDVGTRANNGGGYWGEWDSEPDFEGNMELCGSHL